MSTDSSSKATASTAPVQQTKPSVTQEQKVVSSIYKSEDYDGAPIVKLGLITGGTMQYDSKYKLKLDTVEPTEMPLTPFFAERLNKTITLFV